MKKYHLFLPLLGILLLVSGGCSKRKEPKPLITEAPAVETEIGGYITETESSTPESQSVSGTIRLPIQEPEHQKESSTESEVVSASIYIGSNGSFRAYPYAGGDIVTPESLIAAMADLTGWNLDLAESITGENENSLTVCFARSCSLFTGTASAEKEAFPIYSKDQLYRQILDSICYTLQVNFSRIRICPSIIVPSIKTEKKSPSNWKILASLFLPENLTSTSLLFRICLHFTQFSNKKHNFISYQTHNPYKILKRLKIRAFLP